MHDVIFCYDTETKTKATDILTASNTASADKLEVLPRTSSNLIFPPFFTSYKGIHSSVPALLAAADIPSPLAEISNLDKQPLAPATNKPANPVTANLPVVTEEFTTISKKIEVSIEEETSSTILPADTTLSEVKTPHILHISHSDAYGGTGAVLVHLKFSTFQDHKKNYFYTIL